MAIAKPVPDPGVSLDELWAEHGPAVALVLADGELPRSWPLIRDRLDLATGQKDGWASGLGWYTDLDAAMAEARAAGRAVLSLRMLGRLDEDLSCANSRLFRTLLYPDPAVNAVLRQRYVLHWQSVRDVPVMTIDAGDGRVLRRTITGNSLHLVIDPDDGAVLDVMPGLVDAPTFATWLTDAADANGPPTERFARIAQDRSPWQTPPVEDDAEAAMRLATSKLVIEGPAFRTIRDDDSQEKIMIRSALFSAPPLSPRVVGLLRVKEGGDVSAKVQRLRQTLGEDTRVNTQRLRPQIAETLTAEPSLIHDHEALVRRVYAEVFRFDLDDPWAGLVEPDVLVAIDDAGVAGSE
ncbi:MAG: hypothetical protein AAF710_08460 [Planctomycetota bacterium]